MENEKLTKALARLVQHMIDSEPQKGDAFTVKHLRLKIRSERMLETSNWTDEDLDLVEVHAAKFDTSCLLDKVVRRSPSRPRPNRAQPSAQSMHHRRSPGREMSHVATEPSQRQCRPSGRELRGINARPSSRSSRNSKRPRRRLRLFQPQIEIPWTSRAKCELLMRNLLWNARSSHWQRFWCDLTRPGDGWLGFLIRPV